jgi:hypothetical protein
MLYDAKIIRVTEVRGERRHLIHYQGWNKRFDEAVLRSSLVVKNEEGFKMMERLRFEQQLMQDVQPKKVI